jgi:hypothetical protein
MITTHGRKGNLGRGVRFLAAAGMAVVLATSLPMAGKAQGGGGDVARDESSPWRVGVGAGWSYYSLVSRADAGTTLSALGSYTPTPWFRVEAGVRGMRCADCSRFVIAEGGVQLRLPLGEWAPYLAGGLGMSSDPDFVGTREHVFVGVGAVREPQDRPWGLQLDVRGRQLDPGNRLVEVGLGLTIRVRGKGGTNTAVGSP